MTEQPINFVRADNLVAVRTVYGAKPRYIVSDVASGRYLAVSALAYRLLAQLDGVRSPAEAARGLGLDATALGATLRRLLAAGLVRPVGLPASAMQAPRPAGPVEGRYLFMRRELVELAPVLPMLDRLFGWLFRPLGVALWAVLGITALLALASGLADGAVFDWAGQFTAAEALALFLIFFGLKLCHELGHALALWRTAAAEGLPLHSVRAGVALMLFAPFPFTNASAAWGLSSKWRRAAVGAAGMYIESWAAIIAILIWSVSDDPLLRTACLQVAIVAGLTTLIFNLNPLGRMDGYYILGDLLERPNLAQRAQGAALATAARLFGIRPAADLPPLEPAMLAYWLGMLGYRLLVFFGMVWLALRFSALAALLMIGIAISLLLVRPALATARWLIAEATAPAQVKRRLFAVAGGSLAFLALVPLPAGISADGIVEASGARFVFPPRDVRIAAVAAIGNGDGPVMQLEAPDLLGERARVAAVQSEALELWRRAADSPEAGSAQVAAKAAEGAAHTLAGLDAEIARLTVASAPGWDPLDAADYAGAWVAPDRTRPLAVAIGRGAMRLHALVSEADAEVLRSGGGDAVARIAGRADRRFPARITRIDREARDTLPAAALGRPGGGNIAVDPTDSSGRRAETPMVSVWLTTGADAPTLRHGQRVELRLGAPSRPALWQAAAAAARLLETPVALDGVNAL